MKTLITGASKGIGRALAQEFASNGHDVWLVARDEQLLQELCGQITAQYPVQAQYTVCDLSQEGSAKKLYQELKAQGESFQVLVNNAGIGYLGSYASMEPTTLHDMMQLNMVAVSELTLLFLPDLLSQPQAHILQVSSTASFFSGPFMAVYYASKGYVTALSQAIAYELKGSSLSVSILCPGPTRTNFFPGAGMMNTALEKGFTGMMSPEKVARLAYKGLMKKKLFIIPGLLNKLITYSGLLSPRIISQPIIAAMHKKIE